MENDKELIVEEAILPLPELSYFKLILIGAFSFSLFSFQNI